ncbi:lysosomal acid phosphatase isoform X3 [Anguilla anguilla]|uniref:lysosomal acid phosphatase isoform X3 n=1 Tax=Anguilla anguilla TaxID=7936 RepID=UPI0015AE7EA2|nr:lysosomal acid phosphatase isoform X3 [Anguilla anguilla]XP_035274381.1 lysosomal acid phosphatase isoform X3 [Anguilla anguilla]
MAFGVRSPCQPAKIVSLYLISLTLFSVLNTTFGERKLKFVTLLYRHGDRSPVKAYPTDPYQESAWPQGFGQLSQDGMRQHFELGQALRQRYNGFLNESYDRHQIVVRSTDYDRTLMSAEANLAGMYPPNGSQIVNPDLKWQPIPVHTVPQEEDRLLSFPLPNCPRFNILLNETMQTEAYRNVTTYYKDFIEMLRNKTGLKDASVETVWSVHDTLFCEAMHHMQPPPWVTKDVMEKLKILKDFSFQIMFGVYKRVEKSRLQGGVLLGHILKNMTESAVSGSKKLLKMMMYSAHDTTLVALQSALNVFNGKQPPYASCHIFELLQEDNGPMTGPSRLLCTFGTTAPRSPTQWYFRAALSTAPCRTLCNSPSQSSLRTGRQSARCPPG